jgi:hypothetical protein
VARLRSFAGGAADRELSFGGFGSLAFRLQDSRDGTTLLELAMEHEMVVVMEFKEL